MFKARVESPIEHSLMATLKNGPGGDDNWACTVWHVTLIDSLQAQVAWWAADRCCETIWSASVLQVIAWVPRPTRP